MVVFSLVIGIARPALGPLKSLIEATGPATTSGFLTTSGGGSCFADERVLICAAFVAGSLAAPAPSRLDRGDDAARLLRAGDFAISTRSPKSCAVTRAMP